MLIELSIENFAIIESAKLRWKEGFTAVTGETGAGKSILMNALKLILGERAKADLIRRGADRLRVEAVFDFPTNPQALAFLRELEIDESGAELVIEREVLAGGKNRCRINGSLFPIAKLEILGGFLVDLCGQHEQQALLQSSTHLAYIDAFAGNVSLSEEFKVKHTEFRSISKEIALREQEVARIREQQDFYQFQFNELDKAKLQSGEEAKLEQDLKVQMGLEKIHGCLSDALSRFEGEGWDLGDKLSQLEHDLQQLEKLTGQNQLQLGIQTLGEFIPQVQEIQNSLRHFKLPGVANSSQVDDMNARLALIQKLKSKYKCDNEGLLAIRERRRSELEAIQTHSSDVTQLQENQKGIFQNLVQQGRALHTSRSSAKDKFEAKVNALLANLGMEGSRLFLNIQGSEPGLENMQSLSERGWDLIEFLLAANPGENPKPLRQVASGGEASRVMLAIKAALAEADTQPLLVFDEIDAGIGGLTAKRVGETLKSLAEHHQIFAITHLHQVAACAPQQMQVVKTNAQGRTLTMVKELSAQERIAELARMMGDTESKATLDHARKLLKDA